MLPLPVGGIDASYRYCCRLSSSAHPHAGQCRPPEPGRQAALGILPLGL